MFTAVYKYDYKQRLALTLRWIVCYRKTILKIVPFCSNIRRFDGDFINFKETAEDLGIEGGELMEFFRKK